MPSILTAFRRGNTDPSNSNTAAQRGGGAPATASPQPAAPVREAAQAAADIVAPPAALAARVGLDQDVLRKRAIDLFTFLRELVSLRTTVVRNCESYDRVLWINDVPREPECDCVVWTPPKA